MVKAPPENIVPEAIREVRQIRECLDYELN